MNYLNNLINLKNFYEALNKSIKIIISKIIKIFKLNLFINIMLFTLVFSLLKLFIKH